MQKGTEIMAPKHKETTPLVPKLVDTNEDRKQQSCIETTERKKQTLCNRVIEDRKFRSKFLRTVSLWLTYFSIGWSWAQAGPAFPDLLLITEVSIQTGSLLFSLGSLGYLIGCFIGGLLYDNCNTTLVLFVSLVGVSITSGLFPWCSVFPVMLVVRLFAMIFNSAVETGGNADVLTTWKAQARPYFQSLHFAAAVGGTLSPLVTQLFLAPSGKTTEESRFVENTEFTINASMSGHITQNGATGTWFTGNESQILYSIDSVTSGSVNNTTFDHVITADDTRVQYAYLITACLTFISSVPFLAIYINGKCTHVRDLKHQESVYDYAYPEMSIKKKMVFLFLLAMLFLIYTAIEDSFEAYLVTFTISQLKWTTSDGSLLTSAFWATFAVARFAAIFATPHMDPAKSIIGSYCFTILSFGCLTIASILHITVLVWISVPFIAISMSILYPIQFTWMQENVMAVSGRISSLMMVSASCGSFLNPFVLGYLMESVSPMWFCYLFCGETFLCLIVFLTVFVLSVFEWKQAENITNNNSKFSERSEANVADDSSKRTER